MPHRNAFLLCLIPNLLLCAAVFYENYLLLSGNGSSKMQCSLGFALIGLDYSPIRGPEGNIEYLAWLKTGGENVPADCAAVVVQSHEALDKGGEP